MLISPYPVQCNSEACNASYAGGNASQAAISWRIQAEYARWTPWYYLALVFLSMAAYAYRWWIERTPQFCEQVAHKAVNLGCNHRPFSISYRRFSGKWWMSLVCPPLDQSC